MSEPRMPALDFSTIGPRLGERFPDVRLPDQSGQVVDLHAARQGKAALVVFYRSAKWWPYCKTQLVELQGRLTDFDGADTVLFAISYDPLAVLADFASKHGISYPLLSDEGSGVIRALGLYNEHLAEQALFYGREARPDQYGVPYPGIFHLDTQGIIVDKQFEQSYRVRPAPALLLEELPGARPPLPALSQRIEREGVTATASLDTATYRPYEQHELRVTVQMAPGVHVYGTPIPDGFTALQVRVGPLDGLDVGGVTLPQPQAFPIEGVDDQFLVHEGVVNLVIPFNIVPYHEAVTLSVEVSYQACTDRVCFPPDVIRLDLPLRGIDLIRD